MYTTAFSFTLCNTLIKFAKMNCISAILFFVVGTSIIPGLLPVALAAVLNPAGRFVRDAPSAGLLNLLETRDCSIQEAHERNNTAHAAADTVKVNALAVTLSAIGVALAGVAQAPIGDATAAAALAGAIVDYNAVYVPAEAAHSIAYAAAVAAAVIAINAANSAFTISVTALG